MSEKDDRSVKAGGNIVGSFVNTGEIKESTVSMVSTTSVSEIRTITIDKAYLDKMPQEYAKSLEEFSDSVNKELEKEKVPQDKIAELQTSANEVAKEMADVKPDKEISFKKKTSLSNKLLGLAKSLVSASPKIAETIASMTPLAPFSKVIGEAFEKLVADEKAEIK
jgi:hypothetical protein